MIKKINCGYKFSALYVFVFNAIKMMGQRKKQDAVEFLRQEEHVG